ncbi:tetratricopeptide repeat protein [Rubellicoccus peritrichatus]|uniref:Tetratricopeptide repeat protein n=1 Tax=Rubellicoccus peritrichatus TaxID=3080537 RepID=A0AAQ3L9M3_9BACT|nr:tetratricopeptide repeat protein [Puniceicoccus sp. CR14]WOO39403.1 tetratricopeptide repeat protein [Puniceicoccus sp. CR14]
MCGCKRAWLYVCVLSLLLLAGCGQEKRNGTGTKQVQKVFPETFDPHRLAKVGSDVCLECHADIVEKWSDSHHAWANRPVSAKLDDFAFIPPHRFEEGGFVYELKKEGEAFVLKVTDQDGEVEVHSLEGVIGVDPLVQYLATASNGRFQTTALALDPATREWFDVFAGEGRQPGEWGHWTGQGMNWNANCAYCHMTEYYKNFDLGKESYSSTWLKQGISCVQCHTGIEQHVTSAKQGDYTTGITSLSALQTMESCATCHSRRDQLTPETFRPGDLYADHFALSLPDQPGLYYPDGQIRDEVFVYGSFMMSPMGHAGITCLDCHDPHSNDTILPYENNSLCMRCHGSGLQDAPIIEPTKHSHHAEGSTGNQCVECHMPHTTYMQTDPRRDHGFLSPDPLLTQELGIPNACNGCHTDESVEWAVEWSEKWFGDMLMDKPQRERARAIHAAYEGLPEAARQLLSLSEGEANAAWRATYTGLLGNYANDSEVVMYLRSRLKDESPLVRSRALGGLAYVPGESDVIAGGLDDPVREVRIAAVRAMMARGESIPQGEALKDWETYLHFNADRPQNTFILADEASRAGRIAEAKRINEFAVSLDPVNPEVLRQAAIISSGYGDNEQAKAYLIDALGRAPDDAIYPYSLALIRAEEGELAETVALLQDAVAIDPEFYRAWYNLALALTKLGDWQAASEALNRAAPAFQNDMNWMRTRAVIDQQLDSEQEDGVPPMLRRQP